MDIVMFVLMVIVLVMQAFLFPGKELPLIIASVLGAAYLVFRIFFKKKLPKAAGIALCWALLAGQAVCVFRLSFQESQGGFLSYDAKLEVICEKIVADEYDEVIKLLEELRQEYGDNDAFYALSALNKLSVGNVKEAEADYKKISDPNTQLSILIAEKIYKTEERQKELTKLYYKAAALYPQWEYIQICAGTTRMDEKEYVSALYYLGNAYAVNPKNPATLYFLGVTSYAMGSREDALRYFSDSVENGAGDKLQTLIRGYLDEMDYWNREGKGTGGEA